VPGNAFSALGAALVGLVGLLNFRKRRMDRFAEQGHREG
jgi:LPXTG-motif cell wall-anchored protein